MVQKSVVPLHLSLFLMISTSSPMSLSLATLRLLAQKAPTCEEDGWTGEVQTYCKLVNYNICNWVVTKENEKIPALGHHMVAVADKALPAKKTVGLALITKSVIVSSRTTQARSYGNAIIPKVTRQLLRHMAMPMLPRFLLLPTCYSKGPDCNRLHCLRRIQGCW